MSSENGTSLIVVLWFSSAVTPQKGGLPQLKGAATMQI